MFGTTGDIAETHKLAANVLGFDPIPRLAAAAKILLNIWDTLQLLDVRCNLSSRQIADIFNSSRPTVLHASASQNDVQISYAL